VNCAPAYVPRVAEKTVLYRAVQENVLTFLEAARARDPLGEGLPKFIERSFFKFLGCGIRQKGFIRVRCPECRYDFAVPFS
jgi:hypothetical protein